MNSRAAAPVTAVIAAAGSGERLGAGGPKAFVRLAGRTMVEWSIAAMRAAPSIGAIVVAIPPELASSHLPDALQVGPGEGSTVALAGGPDGLTVVDGGRTRSASVSNALEKVESELVAIHDAARPLVTPELIEGVIATLLADADAAGAIAATPITDTIKQTPSRVLGSNAHGVINPAVVEETLDRGRLWAAQTPQVFRVEALRSALSGDFADVAGATDEAMLVEAAGGRVLIHPSPPENLKVTTPHDLRIAEQLLG